MNAIEPAAGLRLANAQAPLTIALLGYRSHPHVGGQGIYLGYLAAALLKLGHRVDVISGPPYPELPEGARLIRLPSLNLYECEGHHILALRPRHLQSLADLSEWWAMATGRFGEPYSFGRRAFAYLKEHGRHYDVIHDNQSLSYGLVKLQRAGFPVVATIHHPITRDRDLAIAGAENARAQAGARRWYRFVAMQIEVARALRHIVTVSHFAKADIAQAFGLAETKISVIQNGVDTTLFRPLPQVAKVPGRLITTASSDQPLKGLGVLLSALHRLRDSHSQAHLVVIGRIDPAGANAKKLEALELRDRVTFKSGLSARELNEQYNRAEIAVCPSLYEGFGLPAAEAMASGTPVVSSDGGALAEVVGDAGLLVPAGDSLALAGAIAKLLDSPRLAKTLSALGIERIRERFNWHNAAFELTRLYRAQFAKVDHADD